MGKTLHENLHGISCLLYTSSFIEEVKNLEELNGKDYSHLYQKELADYLLQPLDGLTGCLLYTSRNTPSPSRMS